MDITLPTVITSGKKATVYAVVSPLATTGKKDTVVKAVVLVSLDGKGLAPCPTDENGLASIELADLKVGRHTVIATVVGQSPPVTATADFEIEAKIKKPTGMFGRVVMALFWMAVLFFGLFFNPGFLLTGVYLILTIVVIGFSARLKGVDFGTIFGNNNWVFPSAVGMAVLSGIMGCFNPLVSDGFGSWLFGPTTLQDSVFWNVLNRMFFGESFTSGWADATIFYALSTIPAFFVSFSDEFVELGKRLIAHLRKGESFATFALKDGFMEIVWKGLKEVTGIDI